MDSSIVLIISILQIAILDITLSIDNVGIIALAVKDLPDKQKNKASVIGIFCAVGLRILFCCMLTLIFKIQWLPIKLVGGILLLKTTWTFIKPKENTSKDIKTSDKFFGAILSIITTDTIMSLDNVLAIAGSADGHMYLIIVGLLLNIPILFIGSKLVIKLIDKYKLTIYVGGAILCHTALKMIFEDNLILLPHILELILPYILAVSVIAYGMYILKNKNHIKLYN